MKQLLIVLPVVVLAGCGYGWKEEPASYPPSAGGEVVAGQPGARELGRPNAAGEYVVQPGDTLFAIGFRNQVDYRELAAWNNIGGDYLIRPGQVLRLTPPPGADGVLARPLPESSPAPVGAPVPIIAQPPPSPSIPGPVSLPPVATPTVPVLSVPPLPRPVPQGSSVLRWQWPTSGDVIKTYNMAAGSKGIDITGQLGQPVQAVAGGKVVYSGSALKGYGELIIVKHDETYLSAYGHNRRRLVKEGDEVRAGQTIAELGVGPEQKPILHFEIRENGKPVDPLAFLPRP